MANGPTAILTHSFPPPLTTGSFTWATLRQTLGFFFFFSFWGFFPSFIPEWSFSFRFFGKGEVVPQCFVHHHQHQIRAEEVKLMVTITWKGIIWGWHSKIKKKEKNSNISTQYRSSAFNALVLIAEVAVSYAGKRFIYFHIWYLMYYHSFRLWFNEIPPQWANFKASSSINIDLNYKPSKIRWLA